MKHQTKELKHPIKRGFAIIKGGFKTAIEYRLHFFVNLFSVPINILIYYYLWRSIFNLQGSELIKGYTLEEMVTYYVIVMIVGFLIWSDVDKWIEEDIIKGNMVGALMNPLSYLAQSYLENTGLNLLGLIIEFLPVILIGYFIGLTLPSTIFMALFIASVIIAGTIYFLFTYLTGLAAFWLKRIAGIRRSRRVIIAFLSGSMLPLTFFPKQLQEIFSMLPFTLMRFTPVQIYMEKISLTKAGISIMVGLAWIVILYLLVHYVWEKAFKKFSGAGT